MHTDVFPKTSAGRLVMHYTNEWIIVIADKVSHDPGMWVEKRAVIAERQPLAIAEYAESGVDQLKG